MKHTRIISPMTVKAGQTVAVIRDGKHGFRAIKVPKRKAAPRRKLAMGVVAR